LATRYQFSNNAATTLDSALTSGDTTINVVSASAFPASAKFVVIIDNEIILVTGVAGTVWTVARAQEGTSAAAHDLGADVTHIVSAAALNDFDQDADNVVSASRRTRSSAQTIPDNTATTYQAGSTLVADDPEGDVSHDTGLFTINRAGWYLIEAGVLWASNSTGYRRLTIRVNPNDVTPINISGQQTVPNGATAQSVTGVYRFTVGQEFDIRVTQTSTGNLDVDYDSGGRSHVNVVRLRD
jgi:hypothetical protein